MKWNWLTTGWNKLKTLIWQLLGGLIMSEKDGKQAVSLGRVTFLAVLIQLMLIWHSFGPDSPKELPPGLLEVFWTLAGYTFSSKITRALHDKWKK